MGLTTAQTVLSLLAVVLEVALCVLVFTKGWNRRLPFFSAYLLALVAREAFVFGIYEAIGYRSKFALYSAWIAQTVLLIGRGLAIGELAWVTWKPYPGFRVVTKSLLALAASILLVRAAMVSILSNARFPYFVLTLEADLEITAAVILVLLLVLASRYEAHLPVSEKLIAVGLLSYSLVQVVNNTISDHWLQSYFLGWNIVRAASFHISLVLWVIALAKSPSVYANQHERMNVDRARNFLTEGTTALHGLSNQLTRFRRKL
ncbi:MAG: hypothetical protein ACYDCM_02505 [Candidatus Acidiferrales bacterium]